MYTSMERKPNSLMLLKKKIYIVICRQKAGKSRCRYCCFHGLNCVASDIQNMRGRCGSYRRDKREVYYKRIR